MSTNAKIAMVIAWFSLRTAAMVIGGTLGRYLLKQWMPEPFGKEGFGEVMALTGCLVWLVWAAFDCFTIQSIVDGKGDKP